MKYAIISGTIILARMKFYDEFHVAIKKTKIYS